MGAGAVLASHTSHTSSLADPSQSRNSIDVISSSAPGLNGVATKSLSGINIRSGSLVTDDDASNLMNIIRFELNDLGLSKVDKQSEDEEYDEDRYSEHDSEERDDERLLANRNEDDKLIALFDNVEKKISKWWERKRIISSSLFFPFLELESAIQEAFSTGLTPLLLDNSEEGKVVTFFSYQPDMIVLDAQKMILESVSHSIEHCLDYARRCLVNAMKFGKTLVIHLMTSVPDFKNIFCDRAYRGEKGLREEMLDEEPTSVKSNCYFPEELFQCAGKVLKSDERWPFRLFREEDMRPHKNIAICREGFRVLVLSSFSFDDAIDILFGNSESGFPNRNLFQIVQLLRDGAPT